MRTTVAILTALLLLTGSLPHVLYACASYTLTANVHGQDACPHSERETTHAHGHEPGAASSATPDHACCMIQADPDAVSDAVLAPGRPLGALPAAASYVGSETPFPATRDVVDSQRCPPRLLSLHLLHCTFLT